MSPHGGGRVRAGRSRIGGLEAAADASPRASPRGPVSGGPSSQPAKQQSVNRPLATLPPFVPRLFVEDISLNHEKYREFDVPGRALTAASKCLQPSIVELQAALMIADVTGFTRLTEILSKKGACVRACVQATRGRLTRP